MTHCFNTEIAAAVGIEEAILLENIYFWCKKNKANGKLKNGKPFTYNSIKAFNQCFPYMSPSTISRALKNLENNGFVEIGEFNANAYDRTKWYCTTDKANSYYELKNKDDGFAKKSNSICQNEKWSKEKSEQNIADINTDINTDINADINADTDANFEHEETQEKTNNINNSVRASFSEPDHSGFSDEPEPPDAPPVFPSPDEGPLEGIGRIQADIFRVIQNHNRTAAPDRRIPASSNFPTFLQTDLRRLFEALRGESPEDILQGLKNYIKVASSRWAWKNFYGLNDFAKNYRDFSPQFFTLEKWEDENLNNRDKDPRWLFIQRMENDPRFNGDLFVEHWDEWLDGERPEGEEYFKLQAKWEAK